MWAIIKIEKGKLATIKKEFFSKLGNDVKFYIPKMKLNKFCKTKVLTKESYLLGDYLLCFHKDLSKSSVINYLKYCKGLKYFLKNFQSSQNEIEKFISKCRENEDKDGYIKQTFFNLKINCKFEFISGPFTNLIFSILYENKFYVEALMGKYKLTVSKQKNLFRPV